MVMPVTYSGTLTPGLRNSREWESCEQQTDETDRQVADDDVTLELHKSITQKKSHKRSRTKYADFTIKNGMTKQCLGCSRATQVRMEYLRLVSLNRNISKLKGWTLQSSLLMLWMEKTRVNNQTKIDDDENLLKTL